MTEDRIRRVPALAGLRRTVTDRLDNAHRPYILSNTSSAEAPTDRREWQARTRKPRPFSGQEQEELVKLVDRSRREGPSLAGVEGPARLGSRAVRSRLIRVHSTPFGPGPPGIASPSSPRD